MIRRLVLGRGSFPNIRTAVGTVTSIRRDAKNSSYIKSVSVRNSDNSVDSFDTALVVDCTGPAAVGLKWLKEAEFGASKGSPDEGLNVDKLKMIYDHKTRYSTLHFKIPPELGERLPIPGGWAGSGPIYTCFPDSRVDNKVMYSHRVDGDRRTLIYHCLCECDEAEMIDVVVQLCCGSWGDLGLPKTLAGFQKFAQSLVLSKPIPSWFLQLLDMLHEVEDNVDHNSIRIRKLEPMQLQHLNITCDRSRNLC